MKKRLSLLFFTFSMLVGIFFYDSPFPHEKKNAISSSFTEKQIKTQRFPVIRVIDGDTLVLKINKKNEKIRLIGIDTPEIVDPRKPMECFGKEASNEAKRILTGKTVRIETDPSQDIRDKYGRQLVYLFLEDGSNFNEMMIKNGSGYEYTYDVPYFYQQKFKQAEKFARENKKGLWAVNACAK